MAMISPVGIVQDDFRQCSFIVPMQQKSGRRQELPPEPYPLKKQSEFLERERLSHRPILSNVEEKTLEDWIIRETDQGKEVTKLMVQNQAALISKNKDFVAVTLTVIAVIFLPDKW